MKPTSFNSIDEYIAQFPEDIQDILHNIKKVITTAAPDATEAISYQMPTFKLNGNLVHFAAYKNHIGFYPNPSGITPFKEELKGFKTSKGAIQFQLTEPIPYDLIEKIVKYRVKQNNLKSKE